MAQTQLNLIGKSPLVKYLIALASLTAWAWATGYYRIFSVFATYDDEGYVMMSVKNFLDGGVLYDEVYTQYGPSFYLYKQFVNFVFNLPVTTDATRLTTLVVWISIAAGCSIFTYRLTRSWFAAAAVYALTFIVLFRTVYEAGHPQEWCGLIIAAALLSLTGKSAERGTVWRLIFFGVWTALLVTAKINIGVFFGLGAATALTALAANNRLRRSGLTILCVIAAALPFILFRKFLFIGWLNLSVAVAVAVIAARLVYLKKDGESFVTLRYFIIAAVSFAATALFVVLIFLWRGTTFGALLDGVLLQNFRFGDKFYMSPAFAPLTFWWSVFALAVAVGYTFFGDRLPLNRSICALILKSVFGFVVVALPFIIYFLAPESAWMIGLATPFLWIALIEDDRKFPVNQILPRTVLIFVAVMQTLQIFPIPGTQVAYGTFLMIIVAVLCLHDAHQEIRRRMPSDLVAQRLLTIVPAILAVLLIGICLSRTVAAYHTYQRQIPLDLAGAARIRLPADEVAAYTFLTRGVQTDCDELFSLPGLYSFNFWSQTPTPSGFNATAWMTLLTDAQQHKVIADLQTAARPCVIYHQPLTQSWLRDQPLSASPLAEYIRRNFAAERQTGEYQLLIRRADKFEK